VGGFTDNETFEEVAGRLGYYNRPMGLLGTLRRFFEKRPPAATGITIILLQRRIEAFSTGRLQVAMERGWRRKHDPVSFFATNLNNEGAVLKLGKMFVTVLFSDRRVDIEDLGGTELPHWADHSAHVSLSYKCPGGVPLERNGTSFTLFWDCSQSNSLTPTFRVCSSSMSGFWSPIRLSWLPICARGTLKTQRLYRKRLSLLGSARENGIIGKLPAPSLPVGNTENPTSQAVRMQVSEKRICLTS
jgi:hypothetical protein